MEITEKTLISQLLHLEEDITEVFEKHGLFCFGCPGSLTETLEEAAQGHGIKVQELIGDLNEALNKDHR